jgi:multiple sugar transport system ATP-binding protein
MAELVLEGVSKSFPPAPAAPKRGEGRSAAKEVIAAVNKLSLAVGDGELLVLVGPSGSGKTTVLRLIAGLEGADEGVIRLGGRTINRVPPRERNIAMVFQNCALYPHLSVYKNLALAEELRRKASWWRRVGLAARNDTGDERSDIQERVRRTAQMLKIESLLDRRPGQLSGGERQRVALGRALVRAPEAFLLDEPLSNLDAPLRVELRRELKEIHRRSRTTMLYVTHDQVEALTLGDRIGVMDRGKLQQLGSPQEIYDRPRNQFVAGFFGTGMNFLKGQFICRGQRIQFECPGVAFPLMPSAVPDRAGQGVPEAKLENLLGRPIVLGIRPEDVLLREPGSPESGSDAAARGRVSLVEFAGDSLLIHLDMEIRPAAGEREPSGAESPPTLICKTEAKVTARPGDVRVVLFRRARVHWFDGQTGENLAAIPSAQSFPA